MTRQTFRPTCDLLEDRTTPAVIPSLTTGAVAGQTPEVRVFDGDGAVLGTFLAYDAAFTGGVNVALADVTGDDRPEIIAAPKAGGGSNVRVFDGTTFALTRSFYAFHPSFTGGVSLATANLTADEPESTEADIIVGAGAGGGPQVAVFHGRTGELVTTFYAFDQSFTGGVNVAATDGVWSRYYALAPLYPAGSVPTSRLVLKGDWSSGSIVVGAGAGGAPHVKQYDGDTLAVLHSFYAYDPGFRGGVNVAIDWRHVSTFSDTPTLNPPYDPIYYQIFQGEMIVTGAGDGGAPHVKVFAEYGSGATPAGFGEAASFYDGSATETHGVKVELLGTQIVSYTGHPSGPTGTRAHYFSLAGQPNVPSAATVEKADSGLQFLDAAAFGSFSRYFQTVLPGPLIPAIPVSPT